MLLKVVLVMKLHTIIDYPSFQDPLIPIPLNNCNMLVMYTFNDKLFPETLNFISGSG